jgi:hypothetical protein
MFLMILFLTAVALAVAILSRNLRQPSVVVITFGLLALAFLIVVGFISFTSFNPPDWFRIGSSVLSLVSLAGGIGAGVVGLRTPRRWRATQPPLQIGNFRRNLIYFIAAASSTPQLKITSHHRAPSRFARS